MADLNAKGFSKMGLRRVVILGSTGTIGINTLKVIERFPRQFQVVGLTAYHNLKLIAEQVKRFAPAYAAVKASGIDDLKRHISSKATKILDVDSEVDRIVSHPDVDMVVIGMRGARALGPFLKAVRSGKMVAPANKEALVVAGDILLKEARKYNAKIIPIDSEQSAIFQCLEGRNGNEPEKIYLTASGGSLHRVHKNRFSRVSLRQILKHPRWKMGKKITVDSATLMNKGFEVIEAQRLFGIPPDQIEVIIHREAVIHSMVEFQDGVILAQMGVTDMRLPIQYALTYPHRLDSGLTQMNFFQLKKLTFDRPDRRKFPALDLCFHVARRGGTLPCVLNAADEEAVEAFFKGDLSFSQITKVIEKVVLRHKMIKNPDLKEILDSDQWARQEAQSRIESLKGRDLS